MHQSHGEYLSSHRELHQSPPAHESCLFLTQLAIKGDILEETTQTASNEFLTTIVGERRRRRGGRQRLRQQNRTPNTLQWFVGSPLSWCKRTPASDHRGVKCTLRGSFLAPHCGPNDVWNVLIKFCLLIPLTIRLVGWKLCGSASNNSWGNPPDRVSFLTSSREVYFFFLSDIPLYI